MTSNTKDLIRSRLQTQSAIEGDQHVLPVLKLLEHVQSALEWQALVDVEHLRYGVLSYETHIFYRVKKHFLPMVESLPEPGYMLVKVRVPEEYSDVHPELVFADYVGNPSAWETALVVPRK
jgi:hypothetical protein